MRAKLARSGRVGTLLAAAVLFGASEAAALCPEPRLLDDLPRRPVRPQTLSCLHGLGYPPVACSDQMLSYQRHEIRRYLTDLQRYAAEVRSYAAAAAVYSRQVEAFADCEAQALDLR